MTIVLDWVAALPKVLLHDHLDGGLRPATVIELAAEVGHELPATEPEALGRWFHEAAAAGSLPLYLDTFEHTIAVMQTEDALRRVAHEAVLDLAADGVVYAEQRFAPELHQRRGLTLEQVVAAVQQGFAHGVAEAAGQGRTIRIGTLLTAMRQHERGAEIAELALAHRGTGVVGFDLAGPEEGFPAELQASAFAALRHGLLPFTVHAGEGAGPASVAGAVEVGALRLGHGMRLMDDVRVLPDGPDGEPAAALGPLAHWVRDRRIPLEVCPTSNLQTGLAGSVAAHPVSVLKRLGFAVTVNTDNRLQSATSLSRELSLLVEQAGWTLQDIEDVTVTAAQHTFVHEDERRDLIDRDILPAYAQYRTGRHRA